MREGKRDETDREPPDASKPDDPPPAGPHGKRELTNPESTPGAGLLPNPDRPCDAPDSASS